MAENTSQISYVQSLTQAGLEPNQALIYEVLLKNGPLPAGKIHQKTPLKRGLVYKILDNLIKDGLVIKKEEPKKVAVFEPAHPLKLKELAEQKEKDAKSAQVALEGVLDPLTSEYNLAIGKPGVQFYEGLEGVQTVAFDNLTAKTEILAYVDMANVEKYLSDMNKKYLVVRKRLGIKKRDLVNDTPDNRRLLANYSRGITDIRTMRLPDALIQFTSMMQIYDNKVSYITMNSERMIGVIIQDAAIAEMHRQLYLYTWQLAQPLAISSTPPASAPPAVPESST